MSAGGSKSSGDSSSNVTIPQFLEPFVRSSTNSAELALGGLTELLGPTATTEYSGPPIPLNGVRGPNGAVFVDPQRNAIVDSSGQIIAPIQDGVVPGLVEGNNNPVRISGGEIFGQGSNGQNELYSPSNFGGQVNLEGFGPLVAGFTPAQVAAQNLGIDRAQSGALFGNAQDTASRIAGGADVSGILGLDLGDPRTEALESTARGDFLFGGEGFDAAVDAAVRRATPGILSTFGAAGAGGATGGLAQEAIGTAAIDAFASQFAQERSNQLGAAGQLANLDLASGDQQLAQQAAALQGQISGDRTALGAAQILPGLATADIDLLNRIGAMQQEQDQALIDAPRNALLQLLTASLGGTPITSLLGENRRAQQQGLSYEAGLDDIAQLAAAFAGG